MHVDVFIICENRYLAQTTTYHSKYRLSVIVKGLTSVCLCFVLDTESPLWVQAALTSWQSTCFSLANTIMDTYAHTYLVTYAAYDS